MNRKLVGGIMTAAGAVLFVLSALADPIGIGGGGFGARQTIGVVVGGVAMVVGLALMYLGRTDKRSPQPDT